MGGDYTPNYTINGHTASYIDTRLLNSTTMLGSATDGTAVTGEGVTSLCIRGGYSHDLNGAYDIKEYPAVIHQRQRTNDNSTQWDHLFYINDASQRYGYDTYNKSNHFGQQGKDVSKPVTSIPIEIYGVTMQNDQTNKDVLGSVIYYPDAMGANPVSDTDPTKLDKAPEIDGTSEAFVTWTQRTNDNTANSSYQSNTAKVAAGQIPKLILGSDIIFGSGNEADFNPSASATQRQKASAVYIGATGGHALIYNNVFHSNQAHPLITKAPTRIVNSTLRPQRHGGGHGRGRRCRHPAQRYPQEPRVQLGILAQQPHDDNSGRQQRLRQSVHYHGHRQHPAHRYRHHRRQGRQREPI